MRASRNFALERHKQLESLAERLRRTKKISRADRMLLLSVAHAEWDDATHFASPWDDRVSLCGNWYRNLIPIDGKGDFDGQRCWTCLTVRDWLVKHTVADEQLAELVSAAQEVVRVESTGVLPDFMPLAQALASYMKAQKATSAG